MVYRRNNGKLAFNDYDFKELMQLQFYKADSMAEIELIKETFTGIINQVADDIAYKNGFIQKKEKESCWDNEQNEQARYYNKYGY